MQALDKRSGSCVTVVQGVVCSEVGLRVSGLELNPLPFELSAAGFRAPLQASEIDLVTTSLHCPPALHPSHVRCPE